MVEVSLHDKLLVFSAFSGFQCYWAIALLSVECLTTTASAMVVITKSSSETSVKITKLITDDSTVQLYIKL